MVLFFPNAYSKMYYLYDEYRNTIVYRCISAIDIEREIILSIKQNTHINDKQAHNFI